MNLKKNGKVFTSKFVRTGPSSYEKRIYRAAVSQKLRNTVINRSRYKRVLLRWRRSVTVHVTSVTPRSQRSSSAGSLPVACVAGENATCLELLVPTNHTALTGDLEVQLIGPLPPDGRLQLLRATAAQSFTVIAAVPVANSSSSVSSVSFPCGVLTLGGRYRVVLQSHTEVRMCR